MIKKEKNQKIFIYLFIFLAILTILEMYKLVSMPKFYLNVSSSMPKGIYKVIPCKEFKKGDFVIFDVPKIAQPYIYGRKWLPNNWPLIKTVGALPNDQVVITEKSIFINNQYIGKIFEKDHQGKPLPILRGSFKIPDNNWLPIATYIQNSFDGRYFGPIPFNLIRGKAIPILISK